MYAITSTIQVMYATTMAKGNSQKIETNSFYNLSNVLNGGSK